MSVAEFRQSSGDPGPNRLPPQDVAAEQCVLGSMLLSKDAIADVVEVIRGADYYRPAHETVHDAIIDLYSRGEPADAVTVSAELGRRNELARMGGAPYLHTLIASVPSAANAGYYAGIVNEKAILRRLVNAGTKITQFGYAGEGDVDGIVDAAQAEIYAVTEKRASEDYAPLSAVMEATLDEIEAASSRGGQLVGVPTGFADLDRVTTGLHPGQLIVVAARPGMGKALALDTPLPTPTGWTTMRDVAVGDRLLGADGRPTVVLAATEVMNDRPCYAVTFSDGSVIVADAEHQWATTTRAARRSVRRAPATAGAAAVLGSGASAGATRLATATVASTVVTTEQIARTLRCGSDDPYNYAVDLAAPLDLPERELLIAPYVLGAWLGVGHSDGARITSADPKIIERLRREGLRVSATTAPSAYSLRLPEEPEISARDCVVCGVLVVPGSAQVRTCGRRCGGKARFASPPVPVRRCPDCGDLSAGLRRFQRCCHSHGSVQARLRTIGVLGDKHIPTEYLRASIRQRRELLAGLFDTDGHAARDGLVQFAVTNERLARDVVELVHSLGHLSTLRTESVAGRHGWTSTAWIVGFASGEPVFGLPRKLAGQRFGRRLRHRTIVDVVPVAPVPVRCVEVAAADHLYLAGRAMIPTHNSTLGLDLARACSIRNSLTSVIFSLEMGRTEITMRLLSAEAKVPLQHMRQGSMSNDDWSKMAAKMAEVSEAPLFIDDSPNMTMMEIRAKCRRLKQRQNLKLVVIDYLQLMTSGKRVESRQQEVAEFSRSLKLLAKEIEVPVVAISQLNRGPEQRTDKRPMLSDLRESGAIEQDADVVMLLHRDDAYERESTRPGEADFILAKHRNGPLAIVTTIFQGHYSRFVDMASG